MNVIGIIPARFASTRFPGKPLALIAGKPLIRHVVERCRQAGSLSDVIVATDDARIRDAVQGFCRVEMTAPTHPSGSDRIAEVASRCACDAIVNIQGDEPLIDPSVIDAVARALANEPTIILADEPTGNLDVKNSAMVFDLLTRLAKDHGQAVVLVTHNPDIANRCDSVRPMRDGVFV